MSVTVTIYSTSERSFKKEKFQIVVDNVDKAYSFANNAVQLGYWRQKGANKAELIPPHTIQKVLLEGEGVNKGRADTDVTD